MSPEPVLDTPPNPGSDGSTELDQRATFDLLLTEAAVRNYVIAALCALALIALMMVEQGSDIGAVLILILGVCGVALRWTFAPVFVLVVLTYFMYTPTGLLDQGIPEDNLIERRRFNFVDVLLVFSVVVYFISQYRIYSFTYQAIAFEGAIRRAGEPATRRPASLIRPTELATMLALAFALVLVGQLIWWFATSFEVVYRDGFPLQPIESHSSSKQFIVERSNGPMGGVVVRVLSDRESERENVLPPGVSRFYILLGLLTAGALLAGVVFGYWRLKTIRPSEGKMILLDVGWQETHRERARLEKWRIWGRKRAKTPQQSDVETLKG